jgi:probable HAF family extracellular repeat protein
VLVWFFGIEITTLCFIKNRHAIRLNRANAMRRKAPRLLFALKSIGLICAVCFAPVAFAQVRYQITRIPTAGSANSVALGINKKGEVVGYSFQGEDYQAFLYATADQSLTDVGSPWLVLELKRALCLGNLPLWPMDRYWWDRMVLGSGK